MTDSQVARQLRRSVVNSLLYQLLFLLPWTLPVFGQSPAVSVASASVPHLVKFSGAVPGNAHNGVVGITFALYKEEQGGTPLWLETQNVQADSTGHYTVYLGATKADGLPQELFVTGEARWLGVQLDGQTEPPRTLLLSVPYALKAGDAETVGGLPASAFVLAAPNGGSTGSVASGNSSSDGGSQPPIGGSGTQNFIPLWTDNNGNLGNSVMFQSGTGSSAKTGINTATPAATLDVNGGVISRGALQLPSTGTATATGGFNSQPLDLQASAFNSNTSKAIGPVFQWQAEPTGNNTSNPAGTLNLLYGNGSGQPSETGLNIANNGRITFAAGQTFPGAGTITGITAGTGLTGGGTSGNVTLSINVPFANQNYARLAAANTFTANQTVTANLSAKQLISSAAQGTAPLQVTSTTLVPNLNASFLGGLSASAFQPAGSYATLGGNTFSGTQTVNGGDFALTSGNLDLPLTTNPTSGVITMAGAPFIHACCSIASNVFVGMGAGNFTATGTNNTALGTSTLSFDTTGSFNTASGVGALTANTTGNDNTATGPQALAFNTAGANNTANGFFALLSNTSGNNNTALGASALAQNVTGSSNTALGYNAGPDSSHTNLSNATAIGANAVVNASNALVLGGTGSNAVSVGIGTATPASTLDVHGNANFTGAITFAPGQTFPGTGTITGVAAGTDLTGGGSSGSVTLNVDTTKVVTGVIAGTDLTGGGNGGVQTLSLDTTKVPQLNTSNTFTGNQTVNGNLTATGVVTGSSYQMGGNLFGLGNYSVGSVFLGFAGNTTTTGSSDTGVGYQALTSLTTGIENTAVGYEALSLGNTVSNTAFGAFALKHSTNFGLYNTAVGAESLSSNTDGAENAANGFQALLSNTTGSDNIAFGMGALASNLTGSGNTALGVGALQNSTGDNNTVVGHLAGLDIITSYTNATAIGAFATVAENNALVLGSINGLNHATADTNVGIGTTTPAFRLDVHGNANFTGLVTFASGQTFPNTISGVTAGTDLTGGGSTGNVTLNVDTTKVVTGVTAGADLTGGGVGGALTLNLDTTKVPLLAAANNFIATQTISSGNLVLSNGNFTLPQTTGSGVGVINMGAVPLFHACCSGQNNLFMGIGSGNFTNTGDYNLAYGGHSLINLTTGLYNIGVGFDTLPGITTGSSNVAVGGDALALNNTGSYNTAIGREALTNSTTGIQNTAVGDGALFANSTGSYMTALGALAGVTSAHANLTNATAIGAFAEVDQSNAMVLGSINGVNGATADTSVGIGTTTPSSTLDVEATAPGLVGPAFLLKNKAPVQAGLGNSVDLRFALDGGSSVGNPNALIRVAEDGNNQYGSWISFNTMADGGAAQGAQERMRVRSDGFVGIGTSTPDALLSVNGGADKVGGGSWGTYSDGRLKNLDGDYQAGLSEVLKLHPVRYRYKDGNGMGISDREQHIGFVAQEVQKVIPEAVSENSKGYLLVNNDPILWTMLNAIKEQQQQIRKQRDQIESELREIKTQQRQIALLNSKVGTLETAALRKANHPGHRSAHSRALKTHVSASGKVQSVNQPGN